MNSVLNMKDSEYEWIGTVPSHWNLKKIKFVFWERKENNDPIKSENLISLTIEKGVIPHSEKTGGGNKPKDDLTKYKLVYPGDIVINSMNVIAGAVGISKYFGVVSPVYYMLIPRKLGHSNEYFHHLFRTEIFQKSLYGLGNGILIHENEETGKLNTIRMRIPMNKLGDQFIPVPPIEEQKLISRYLDKKTEQIDQLVEKIQKKIELLKEQRTSLINQCVTKGLDPNVEMKDSGVEWIGEIPSSWGMAPLGKLGELYGGLTGKNGNDFNSENNPMNKPFIPFTNIFNNTYISKDQFQNVVIENDEKQNKVRKHDLFFLMSSETHEDLGKSSILIEDVDELYLNSFCKGFRITQTDVYPLFLNYQLTGDTHRQLISVEGNGFTRINLRQNKLNTTPIVLPPVEEQKLISRYLDKKTEQIDQLVEKIQKKIDTLKDYRQSLISSAVTGKFRVTEDMI